MKTLKYLFGVMDLQTLIVTLLALGSTWACLYFGFTADIPTGLIGLAVVFPIVFSINTAYKRREEALRFFSGVKAHLAALYYAHRDWVPAAEGESAPAADHAPRVRAIIERLLAAVHADLSHFGRRRETFERVYQAISELSGSNEQMRRAGVPANEISRVNQYVSKIAIDYERMRNIASYRTPVSLRAYSRVFLNLFPIAFGPYFASLCLENESFPYVGYMVAVLYALVLVTLDNIQEDLEDPFDDVGTDDVKLDVADDFRSVVAEREP
jgi:predicted membrane chloride channel (bestrophin family)